MKKILILLSLILMFNCSSDSDGNPIIPPLIMDPGDEEDCQAPGYLSLNETSPCTIDIGWDDFGTDSWEIEYGEVGFTLGTGTSFVTSEPGSIQLENNIEPETSYEIYIRTYCGSDGYSDYADTLVATTGSVTLSEITSSFDGEYLLEDVSASVGPTNNTQNFENAVVTLVSIPFEENKKRFEAAILPGILNIDFEVIIEFDVDSTVKLSEDIFTPATCDDGASNYRYTGIGANTGTFQACDDSYFVVNYVEDPDGSCGGPFQSSFSLTKL